ncbi:TetR family transcriptional regulator [Paraburkholderia bryophila]|uniref:TetR family transcriptional regulator n=1 Tax=Paraburkholderia bryophila TaxID=420952 RepID=A0A329BVF6_9BURK|nr:TetR family transcriptional regulator [Paraburkholderia bryophila]
MLPGDGNRLGARCHRVEIPVGIFVGWYTDTEWYHCQGDMKKIHGSEKGVSASAKSAARAAGKLPVKASARLAGKRGTTAKSSGAAKQEPPRERVLAAAAELFYSEGIRATGVEAIAARASTTKMALYRHFQSKDALIVEWLRQVTGHYWAAFDRIEAAHAGDPRAQILGWATFTADEVAAWSHRGCPFINSIAELPDREHPARQLIEEHKARQWTRLAGLCEAAGLALPEETADEIMIVLEGAQVVAQNRSVAEIGVRARRIVEAIVVRQTAQTKQAKRKPTRK